MSGLGLYNSCPERRRRACPERCRRDGARFYSTLTGRFLSPDPFVPDVSEVTKVLGPALMVTQPGGFSGHGGDSVYGPVEGLAREGHTVGLHVYVPADADETSGWPTEGFMPRQDLLDLKDLNGGYAPGGDDEPSGWPRDTFAPNPQPLNRFAYVLNNPLRYTDPTGYCAFCDWVGDVAGDVGGAVADFAGNIGCNGCNVAEFATGAGLLVVGVVVTATGAVLLVIPGTEPAGVVLLLEVAIPIEVAAIVLITDSGCIVVVY